MKRILKFPMCCPLQQNTCLSFILITCSTCHTSYCRTHTLIYIYITSMKLIRASVKIYQRKGKEVSKVFQHVIIMIADAYYVIYYTSR